MKKRIISIVGLTIVALVASGMWYYRAHAPVVPQVMIIGPNGEVATVMVEVADSSEERTKGLMHRTSLEQGHGMFFIFDEEQPLSFWMKNTLIPLDIIFFDERGEYVSRATMQPCTTEQCPLYTASADAQYALEVNADDPATQAVTMGWMLEIDE